MQLCRQLTKGDILHVLRDVPDVESVLQRNDTRGPRPSDRSVRIFVVCLTRCRTGGGGSWWAVAVVWGSMDVHG